MSGSRSSRQSSVDTKIMFGSECYSNNNALLLNIFHLDMAFVCSQSVLLLPEVRS